MVQVTSHFRISAPVDFVDVHVDGDRKLFLDPSAVRNDPSPLGRAAYGTLVSFFTQVLTYRASGDARGRHLLDGLHEPNHTRLGYSAGQPAGSAFGEQLAENLWMELGRNPAARAAVLTRLEDLPLFLDKVSKDLISDLATRIVFDHLIDFTEGQMGKHSALHSGAVTRDLPVYDVSRNAWRNRTALIPYAGPLEMLLVPVRWVNFKLEMNQYAFYNRFSTEVIQEEQTRYVGRRRERPSKKTIKQDHPHVRPLNIDKAVEYKARDSDQRDLVGEYRGWVDDMFEPLGAQAVERYLNPPPSQ